ncbi:MAG: arginine--tRNA ligase, partial [Clostridia bacterium]|nr:arginine--tRNA ligase [Clostridia bacterium]
MDSIVKLLSDKLSAAFLKAGYGGEFGQVMISARPDLCQFQCNGCFAAAKQYKKAPFDVASEVSAALSGDGDLLFADAVKPGFINLSVTDGFLVKSVNALLEDGSFGAPNVGEGKNLIVDYGGANVAKPLHIGHLRPAILGEGLKRLARICGYNAIGDVHMGDWGMPLGLVIAEMSVRHPEWRCFQSDFDPKTEKVGGFTVDDLNEIYPFASKKSKEDEAFKALAHEMTCRLQDR